MPARAHARPHPEIAHLARALADPSRAAMLDALMDALADEFGIR